MLVLENLNPVAEGLVEVLLTSLIPGIVVTLLIWFILRLFSNLNATTKYVVWFMTLLTIVMLPLIVTLGTSSLRSANSEVTPTLDAVSQTEATPIATQEAQPTLENLEPAVPTAQPQVVAPSPSVSAERLRGLTLSPPPLGQAVVWFLCGAYLMGILLLLVQLFRSYASLAGLKRASETVNPAHYPKLETGQRPITLKHSKDITVPMAAGLGNPVILLPSGLEGYLSKEEVEHVILHEAAHLARYDDWTKLFQQLVHTLFFFHPAVHFIDRQLSLEREIASDDWVVARQGKKRHEYAQCLVRLVELALHTKRMRQPLVEGSAVMVKTQIEKRIKRLLDGKRIISHKIAGSRLLSVIAVLGLATALLSQFAPTIALAKLLSGPFEFKLLASDGSNFDQFGSAVAIDGEFAIVGAKSDSDNGFNSGAAYIYAWNGASWDEQTKLLTPEGVRGSEFGEAVAISGDTVIVGAPDDGENGSDAGAAYIFARDGDTWTQQARLLASDGGVGDQFGNAVGISGERAIVAARFNEENGEDAGAAYVFVRDGETWQQEAKLLPEDPQLAQFFGESIAISGDTAVIGAIRDGDKGIDAGAAYVFVRNGSSWQQQAKLLASNGQEGDSFGTRVAVRDDQIIVSSMDIILPEWFQSDTGISGGAYIFVSNGGTWTEQTILYPHDGQGGQEFGQTVAIDGDTALVGAPNFDNNPGNGSVYVFARQGETWAAKGILKASDGEVNDQFGIAVALSGDTALVSAQFEDESADDAGAAYVFDVLQLDTSEVTSTVQ
jgi:beta-lactamase regulating signal transducer with metallopeptidase domain